jgi:hypothetical protein
MVGALRAIISRADNVPKIDLETVPAGDVDDLRLLNLSLRNMDRFVHNFAAAIDLFEFCRANPHQSRARAWIYVACRDAVMQIWHFIKSMNAANAIANKSETLKMRLNKESFGQAFDIFRATFPDFEASRHAVAHSGEMTKNVSTFQQHAYTGGYQGENIKFENFSDAMIQDSLDGRKFLSTHEGKLVTCDISPESLSALRKIQELFYAGFD